MNINSAAKKQRKVSSLHISLSEWDKSIQALWHSLKVDIDSLHAWWKLSTILLYTSLLELPLL